MWNGHRLLSVFGTKPMDVSIHEPQLQPPPPSGDNSMPPAGIVLSQQSGRSLDQLDFIPDSGFHMVNVPAR